MPRSASRRNCARSSPCCNAVPTRFIWWATHTVAYWRCTWRWQIRDGSSPLTLIDPVFFAALKYVGDWTSYLEFCRVRDEFVSTLARGERQVAMRRFVGFWMGNDAWAGLPAGTRANMLKAADQIVLAWQASLAADPGRACLSALEVRTLLVRGSDSPLPMRSLVDALHAIMPGSAPTVVEGANHLLPLPHASLPTTVILSNLRPA